MVAKTTPGSGFHFTFIVSMSDLVKNDKIDKLKKISLPQEKVLGPIFFFNFVSSMGLYDGKIWVN